MDKNLAPKVLYRPDHTRQTIEVLQKNELAKDSELFIYSDAFKHKDANIRIYTRKIEGNK